MAARVSPARVGGGVSAAAARGGRGPIAVMLLALLDESVVRALHIRLLLHEFEDPSLVRQRSRLRLVCHLWPALCMQCRTRLRAQRCKSAAQR